MHQKICVGNPTGKRFCISFGMDPDQGLCFYNCSGTIYENTLPDDSGPIVGMYVYTTPDVDAQIYDLLQSLIGTKGIYSVTGGTSCRDFSQAVFNLLRSNFPGSKYPMWPRPK